MSLVTYRADTDTAEVDSGRIADAYTKQQTDNRFDEQIDAGFLQSKNLYSPYMAQIGTQWNSLKDSTNERATVFVEVNQNSKYTITASSVLASLYVVELSNVGSSTSIAGYNTTNVSDLPLVITTNSSTRILALQLKKASGAITISDINSCNIQLEKGEVATSYIPSNGMSNKELTSNLTDTNNKIAFAKLSSALGVNSISEAINKTYSIVHNKIRKNYVANDDGFINIRLRTDSVNGTHYIEFGDGTNTLIIGFSNNGVSAYIVLNGVQTTLFSNH